MGGTEFKKTYFQVASRYSGEGSTMTGRNISVLSPKLNKYKLEFSKDVLKNTNKAQLKRAKQGKEKINQLELEGRLEH